MYNKKNKFIIGVKMKLNINSDILYFGIPLGFKLSRLEYIWGSKYDFVKKEFEPIKTEILKLLPTEDMHIDKTSYISFCQSILNFYLRTSIATYSAILIGICIQRCLLIGVSKDEKKNEELHTLAKSALKSIPNMIVSNKIELFKIIYEHKTEDLYDIISILEQSDKNENTTKNYIKKPTLFLSYSSKDSSIADILENQLKQETNNGIEISRFTEVPYKGSFRSFMNSIQDHDFVLCIVSDNYLKSQACMYEVGEIIKDHNFHKKLLFVIIGENDKNYFGDNIQNFAPTNIYDNKNKFSYIQYWKHEYESMLEKIKIINNLIASNNLTKELRVIKRIFEDDISEFLDYLSDINGKSFEELYNNKFSDIIKCIFPN